MINDEVMVTADNNILMLNGDFETVECYNGRARCAQLFDGNENFIALGLQTSLVNQSVHFFPRSGDEQETVNPTVSQHTSSIEIILF